MASVNKVILVGNLGRDPDVRYTADGAAVCNLSVATTSSWKDKATGERREETEWHRVVFHNRLAEVARDYLHKGRAVYIEGRLKTRKWQDRQTGADRYTTEIVGDQMQMLGERVAGNAQQQCQPQNPPRNDYAEQSQTSARSAAPAAAGGGNLDDDIPFAAIGAGRAWSCI